MILGLEGIQVCSNEGEPCYARGDNRKRVKLLWKFLRVYSGTSRPISNRLDKNRPSDKEILS
jgi:hypothetical protein